MKYFILPMFFLLSACTYNVSMAHTSGHSTDTIDDTATNTPDVSPEVSIPLSPGV